MSRSIAARLLAWYDAGHRDLPWRRNSDPYRIWISEVMLQQTRAEAVIPYYERFLQRFPDAAVLARAPLNDVLACWSGLGYYSRARNLHKTASLVAAGFPRSYTELRQLAGVGDYTAAAIASIAFDLPHAVLDGNVMRVIARVTNDAADIASGRTRSRFREIAQGWLDRRRAGAFNQALMELGATVCLPRAPRCPMCPLSGVCRGRQEGRAAELPVKLRQLKPVEIAETLLVIARRQRVLMWQRPADSKRLAGFWELPSPGQVPRIQAPMAIGTFRHTITHHHYQITVQTGAVRSAVRPLHWIPIVTLKELPLSTTARKALKLARVPV
jgi:A/G-specific adenine glycosylase